MRTLFTLCMIGLSLSAVGQFLAVQNGDWNRGTTWGGECATGCIAGTDYPGPNDDAYTEGFVVRVPNGTFSVSNVYVAYNVVNGLNKTLGTATLIIRGQLAAYDPATFDYATPTTSIVNNTNSGWTIQFTGEGLLSPTDPIITSWSNLATLRAISVNPPSAATTLYTGGLAIADQGSLTIQNGTLQLNSGEAIQASTTSATITVNSGGTLNVQGMVNGDGSNSSLFPTIIINGTLRTGSSGYINSTSFTLGAAGQMDVGFFGANQTQGWWYQSALPSTLSINSTSTVNYIASASQNIYATTYGNLSLTSQSSVSKSLSGTGLALQGNLSIGSNVTFAPSSQVDFNGTTAQSVTGAGSLTLLGGLEVNKSSGALTMLKNFTTNGLTVTAGELNLGDVNTTLSGSNFLNSGTVSSGTAGTLTISGSTAVTGAGSMTLNNLSISGTAVFNNSAFSMTGNLTNSGSFSVASTSTVTFTGGVNQTISGNAFSMGNVVVNKTSSTLSNDGDIELRGVLTVTTGTFDADGEGSGVFTLNSDTNGDAAIGQMSGGSITGQVTFERYFNNTNNRWRNIGFPVTFVDYSELGASITLTNGSLGTYTESTSGNADQGWNIISSGTLNSRLGHSAYMYNVQPITISVRGPLLQNVPSTSTSPYNFQVTYTNDPGQPATEDGWNFIPNPYASPIDWNASSGWTKNGLNAAAAVWDTENGSYAYSNISWDGVLAAGQSFWVQTNAVKPTLTSTESVKVTNSDPTFYREKSTVSDSRLLVTLSDNTRSDKALIQFRSDAQTEFDAKYDAVKLKNLIFNLSSLSPGGLNLAANALPRSPCTDHVKLNITNIAAGKYYLRVDGVSGFSGIESIMLTDHYTGATKILGEGESYSFAVTEESSSFGAERFELAFLFNDGSTAAPEITQEHNRLVSSYDAGNQWYYDGVRIDGATEKTIKANKAGTYQVEVALNGCSSFSVPFEVVKGNSRLFPNPVDDYLTVDVSGLANGFDEGGHILVYSLRGEVVQQDSFGPSDEVKILPVKGIKPGAYVLRVFVHGAGLVEERVIIK